MGTNYYLKVDKSCPRCRIFSDEVHIGKASYGWCFALRVYPDKFITCLEDWAPILVVNKDFIVDEYGNSIIFNDLVRIIKDREGENKFQEPYPRNNFEVYKSWEEMHAESNTLPTTYGLLRRQLGGEVLSHGAGPWDCIEGDFS